MINLRIFLRQRDILRSLNFAVTSRGEEDDAQFRIRAAGRMRVQINRTYGQDGNVLSLTKFRNRVARGTKTTPDSAFALQREREFE